MEGTEETKKAKIVKCCGFDDIDDDLEPSDAVFLPGLKPVVPTTDRKRKRGGKKRNRRHKRHFQMDLNADELLQAELEFGQRTSQIKSSRLIQELHDRERIHGMGRQEARQLLEDKLLFLDDSALKNVRFRRFCIVMTSEETFDLGNGSSIPSEIVSVSMDNGKINSILRFFPTYTKTFEMENVQEHEKCRMKRVYWNPSIARDSNQMCRTWSHFLDRCLHSLLLVPLAHQTALLDFLRKINEIRSVLNHRSTVSICLSRVVSVEDLLIAVQNVIGTHITPDATPTTESLGTMEHALEYCRFYLRSMNKIFMSATMSGNAIMSAKPPTQSSYFRPNAIGQKVNYNWVAPRGLVRLPDAADPIGGFGSCDSRDFDRVLEWVSAIDLDEMSTSDELEQKYDNEHEKEEEEEEGESSTGSLDETLV
ncbi:unnamed protein product [Caenorhabditis sp. 36 PRJEB53466]|nr:unnamed protein product [Caenorhabditis sp. 36 PRJEB53466]